MPTVRKITAEKAGDGAPSKTKQREQQIATIVQHGHLQDLLDRAVTSLRAMEYQIQPHGLKWRVRYKDADPAVDPTVMDAPALLSLAAGFDAGLDALIAARAEQAQQPKPAPVLPPLPEDLAGWAWELNERGLRLVCPLEGYATAWYAPDLEASCIVEARRIVQRDVVLVVEERARSALATPIEPSPPAQDAAAPAPILILLTRIDDNPYQPRLVYDEERIGTIAASIREHGLLQVPLARPISGGRYQLAFGHSRLRAFKRLAAVIPSDMERWGRMPLVVRELDDETMALHAWIENRDRKDLTVYEEARAIERYTTSFGWSQKQAAEKLQLDRSTVANKLRLLKLPEVALKQLQDGTISERQAVALLPLADLPEELRTSKRRMWLGHDIGDIAGPDELVTKASNLDSTRLRRAVENTMNDLTVALAQQPWRDGMWDLPDVHAPRCADCPLRIKSSDRCPDKACAGRKAVAWQAQQASAAAAAAGLPTTTHRGYSDRDDLGGVTLSALKKVAAEKQCGNLAVLFDDSRAYYSHTVAGFDHCFVVCGHGPGHRCGCKQALARRADPTSGADAKKRHDRQRIKVELMAPAEQAVAAALATGTVAVWRKLFEAINSHAASKVDAGADIPTIQAALASHLVANTVGYHLEYGYYDSSRTSLAKLLRDLGASVPWEAAQPAPDVCVQTSADDPLAPLQQRLDKIASWVGGWVDATPSPDAIDECRERLGEVADELEALVDVPGVTDDDYETLARSLGDVEQALQNLAEAIGTSALESGVAS